MTWEFRLNFRASYWMPRRPGYCTKGQGSPTGAPARTAPFPYPPPCSPWFNPLQKKVASGAHRTGRDYKPFRLVAGPLHSLKFLEALHCILLPQQTIVNATRIQGRTGLEWVLIEIGEEPLYLLLNRNQQPDVAGKKLD